MKILVTGASGFIGSNVCKSFPSLGFSIVACSRKPLFMPSKITSFLVDSYASSSLLLDSITGIDVVLHLAGRAHILRETKADPSREFFKGNVDNTLTLAALAAKSKVSRFIFVSSIKVNGETTSPHSSFTEEDQVNPADPYSLSKYQAELGLFQIAAETGMEVVIVRPPLIYGPGVKGNFRVMMKLLKKNVPLPLGLITDNKRSLLSIDNLVDFLASCAFHPEAAGRVFLVSDQHDVSTAELLLRLGAAMGLSANLFPVPRILLKTAANLTRNQTIYQRLCCSLVVDSSAASRLLGWGPPLTLDEGLRRAAMDFVA